MDGVSVILLIVESVLFGMFTSCMMMDQWSVVSTNVTQIDRLKGDDFSSDQNHDVNEVFGGEKRGVSFWWFIPSKVKYPESVIDELYGYSRPALKQAVAKDWQDDSILV